MTSEFPLLSAVLEQSIAPLPPAGDVGRVLGALGIAGSSYHSFEPLRTPEAQPAEARISESPRAAPGMTVDDVVAEPAYAEPVARQAAPAAPIHSGRAAAEPLWRDPKPHDPTSHEPFGEAPVWTTPTLGIPTRTEPRVMAHAVPAPPVAHAVVEHASTEPARSRDPSPRPGAPERSAAWTTSFLPRPDQANPAPGQPPVTQTLSLGALFRILGAPTQTPAGPLRTLRDVFGYSNKRNS